MAEYLHPGVYIEETSYRAKSIEGVSTSTTGFVGQCAYGPVSGLPTLVTSFEEFRRQFGGLEDLVLDGVPTPNWMAHAVRAYFENGGKRLYIARVFAVETPGDLLSDYIAAVDTTSAVGAVFRARHPGQGGNLDVAVTRAIGNSVLVIPSSGARRLSGLRTGDLVSTDPTPTAAIDAWAVRDEDGTIWITSDGTTPIDLGTLTTVRKVSLTVTVTGNGRSDSYADLSTHPSSARFIGNVLRDDAPYDTTARIWLDLGTVDDTNALTLAGDLTDWSDSLIDGDDGAEMTDVEVTGAGEGDTVTGLVALAEVEDIAIVACPGGAALTGTDQPQLVRDALISHCERLVYRFAVVSAPDGLDVNGIRSARAVHDSSYAALYYPWVTVRDPNGQPGDVLNLPPDGFVCGIYARSDVNRGVHKAPANETVRGILRFAVNVNERTQDVLNPEGINCLRSFEGRGRRIWGARTLSSDPEWKYVNVRRLFIYLEHSIDRATQWVVFEPNNPELWLKVTLTIESFLVDTWRTGALMGTSEKEAFFVRCDRTTMTQGDLDNGRLICLIGVSPTYPAEFVIFRIGQWTAEASIV